MKQCVSQCSLGRVPHDCRYTTRIRQGSVIERMWFCECKADTPHCDKHCHGMFFADVLDSALCIVMDWCW
jgi:hypothetical protein